MPELPDVTVYVEALERRILGKRLVRARLLNPFVLRTVEPPVDSLEGKQCVAIRRIGKRIAMGFENDIWLVIHLMIAGRLHWKSAAPKLGSKLNLAAFEFESGVLVLTEAGAKRRASIALVDGEQALREFDRGGLEVLTASLNEFSAALQRENHTVKRALTDPRLFSGIGNAYSDEILHRAGVSPLTLTSKLDAAQRESLYHATLDVMNQWIERLRGEAGDGFPEKVTAFRPEMAVHGRFGLPCPDCSAPIQRIRYADNETNYCPRCQTGGRVLADRSLSRLLKDDWPRHLDDL